MSRSYSRTDMKPKDESKLEIVELGKSETYLKENKLAEYGLYRCPYEPGEQDKQTKDNFLTLFCLKNQVR